MNPTFSTLNYRRAAVQNASPVGLVIMLYDTLVGDLDRAIAAIEKGDIEERSSQLKHAAMVLQQLEGWLDMEHGGEAGQSLSNFYTFLRSKLMEAQFTQEPEILRNAISLVLEVRQAWQQVDCPTETAKPNIATAASNAYAVPDEDRQTSDWCA